MAGMVNLNPVNPAQYRAPGAGHTLPTLFGSPDVPGAQSLTAGGALVDPSESPYAAQIRSTTTRLPFSSQDFDGATESLMQIADAGMMRVSRSFQMSNSGYLPTKALEKTTLKIRVTIVLPAKVVEIPEGSNVPESMLKGEEREFELIRFATGQSQGMEAMTTDEGWKSLKARIGESTMALLVKRQSQELTAMVTLPTFADVFFRYVTNPNDLQGKTYIDYLSKEFFCGVIENRLEQLLDCLSAVSIIGMQGRTWQRFLMCDIWDASKTGRQWVRDEKYTGTKMHGATPESQILHFTKRSVNFSSYRMFTPGTEPYDNPLQKHTQFAQHWDFVHTPGFVGNHNKRIIDWSTGRLQELKLETVIENSNVFDANGRLTDSGAGCFPGAGVGSTFHDVTWGKDIAYRVNVAKGVARSMAMCPDLLPPPVAAAISTIDFWNQATARIGHLVVDENNEPVMNRDTGRQQVAGANANAPLSANYETALAHVQRLSRLIAGVNDDSVVLEIVQAVLHPDRVDDPLDRGIAQAMAFDLARLCMAMIYLAAPITKATFLLFAEHGITLPVMFVVVRRMVIRTHVGLFYNPEGGFYGYTRPMITNKKEHIGRRVQSKITVHGGAIITNSACFIPLPYAVPGGVVNGGSTKFATTKLDHITDADMFMRKGDLYAVAMPYHWQDTYAGDRLDWNYSAQGIDYGRRDRRANAYTRAAHGEMLRRLADFTHSTADAVNAEWAYQPSKDSISFEAGGWEDMAGRWHVAGGVLSDVDRPDMIETVRTVGMARTPAIDTCAPVVLAM